MPTSACWCEARAVLAFLAAKMDPVDEHLARVERILAPYRDILRFLAGALANFYGRHFTYTFLYAQIFRSSAWPIIRKAVSEIRSSQLPDAIREGSNVARTVLQRVGVLNDSLARARQSGDEREAQILEAELAELQQELLQLGPAAASFMQAADPNRLQSLAQSLYDALVAIAAEATSHGPRKLGVGVNIGGKICTAVDDALTPLLRRVLQRLRAYSQLLDYLHADPSGQRWLELGLRTVCSSIGIALAFRIEAAVFCAANALWGAELMIGSAALAAREILRRSGRDDSIVPSSPGVPYARIGASAGVGSLTPFEASRWLLASAGGERAVEEKIELAPQTRAISPCAGACCTLESSNAARSSESRALAQFTTSSLAAAVGCPCICVSFSLHRYSPRAGCGQRRSRCVASRAAAAETHLRGADRALGRGGSLQQSRAGAALQLVATGARAPRRDDHQNAKAPTSTEPNPELVARWPSKPDGYAAR